MALESQRDANELVIRINGEFDFGLHRQFRDAYRDESGVTRYVVDLSDTEYMDSSALGMLLLLREHAEARNGKVFLKGVDGEIERILRIANFHQLFSVND
ncbi:anti-anti-sigma factor [Natronocella acetinitrilica]|uniref:Anti-sigma factor antagonist n=1 Tax=Natronocella acetinitrilica TaxID=414046 RepID=A0AAE3KCA7_9GAMM|nr:STAS domain-containing protein [Natronocella acetinitrilica]MCP1675574.1 anti-anti-sigma factor [Natronocella acetinitrilica]